MPRNMSMRKVIRVQKLQNKNRMVGQTFNPSGITAEQYDTREKNFVKEMQAKSQEELQAYYKNMKEMQKDWTCSYPWEWSAFERNFYIASNGEIR